MEQAQASWLLDSLRNIPEVLLHVIVRYWGVGPFILLRHGHMTIDRRLVQYYLGVDLPPTSTLQLLPPEFAFHDFLYYTSSNGQQQCSWTSSMDQLLSLHKSGTLDQILAKFEPATFIRLWTDPLLPNSLLGCTDRYFSLSLYWTT